MPRAGSRSLILFFPPRFPLSQTGYHSAISHHLSFAISKDGKWKGRQMRRGTCGGGRGIGGSWKGLSLHVCGRGLASSDIQETSLHLCGWGSGFSCGWVTYAVDLISITWLDISRSHCFLIFQDVISILMWDLLFTDVIVYNPETYKTNLNKLNLTAAQTTFCQHNIIIQIPSPPVDKVSIPDLNCWTWPDLI